MTAIPEPVTRALRIGITQRSTRSPSDGIYRDSLDDTWPRWFGRVLPGASMVRIPNAPDAVVGLLDHSAIDVLILSGGEDVGSSPLRDDTEWSALEFATHHQLPVIGICRGMQFLQVHTGGRLVAVDGHVGSTHEVTSHDGTRVKVNSWHRWGIREAAAEWQLLALASDGTVEAYAHRKQPWLGVMSHPERDGGAAVSRWVEDLLARRAASG